MRKGRMLGELGESRSGELRENRNEKNRKYYKSLWVMNCILSCSLRDKIKIGNPL